MRINFITELFYPHIGGQETRYYRLGKELAKRGNEVNIYTIRYSENLKNTDNMCGINIHRIFPINNYIYNYKRSISGLIKFSSQLNSFLEEITDKGPIIINEMPILHLIYNCSLIKKSRAIIDWVEHWPNPFYIPLFKKISKCANWHITLNKDIYNSLIRYNVRYNRICLLPPAIDLRPFRAPPKDKIYGKFVYVGRLVKHKNIDLILKAFARAVLENKKLSLIIVGDGPEKNKLKKMAQSLNILNKVFFKGQLSHEEVIKVLKNSYSFIIASSREGFSWSIVEALASGTPVISTNLPNNYGHTIIEKSGGGLVVKHDEFSLAVGIKKMLDVDLWNEFHQNALLHSRNFDIKERTSQLLRFLASM
jgi:glycosyltransferase involved in cell wall biosynthesis